MTGKSTVLRHAPTGILLQTVASVSGNGNRIPHVTGEW